MRLVNVHPQVKGCQPQLRPHQGLVEGVRLNRAFPLFLLFALVSLSRGSLAQGQTAPSSFSPVQFLVGDWAGGGGTDAGQATGRSSIKADLDGHVLVRRDHTDIPASQGKPASSMDVLMLIYPQTSDGRLHATYTDSGGHVIQYRAVRVEPGRLIEFDSDLSLNAPTFRLTYTISGPEALEVRFEMAAPGRAEFHPVAVGTLRRLSK